MTTQYVLDTQLSLILAALRPDNRLVCRVMLYTGLRVGDVLALRCDQLARCFWITEQKTGKRRKVGLPDALIAEIRARAGGSPWAFPSPRDPAKPRTRQAVWSDLNRVAKALRLPPHIGTHSMRKSFAVDLMAKYGDIEKVQKALNHSNPSVTVLYAMADKLAESYDERRGLYRRKR
jgi:integrase